MPPPVPWFRGRTVVVSEVDGMLRFRPLGKPVPFAELALPSARIVVAVAEAGALGFQGDFDAATDSDDVVLAPLDPDDALQIERVLAQRLGLPRAPQRIARTKLETLREWTFVSIDGELAFWDPPTLRRLRA